MDNKRILTLPVTLEGFSRTKDRCVTLREKSQIEVDSDCIRDIDTFMGKLCWLVLSEDEIQDADIPDESVPVEGKTQSQRIRDVLYVYWNRLKDKGDTRDDFNTFYMTKTEKIINHFKEKLDT